MRFREIIVEGHAQSGPKALIAWGENIGVSAEQIDLDAPKGHGGGSCLLRRRYTQLIEDAGRRGQWRCLATCNVQGIGGRIPSVARVIGEANGANERVACREAKRAATQQAPRGTYARHCKCDCKQI